MVHNKKNKNIIKEIKSLSEIILLKYAGLKRVCAGLIDCDKIGVVAYQDQQKRLTDHEKKEIQFLCGKYGVRFDFV